jgi:hypothetical protein
VALGAVRSDSVRRGVMRFGRAVQVRKVKVWWSKVGYDKAVLIRRGGVGSGMAPLGKFRLGQVRYGSVRQVGSGN